jgi:hypothetical protein
VNEGSIGQLLKAVDQKLAAGAEQFTLLISTSGGSVFHGLTAFNYLRASPRGSQRTTSAASTRSASRCTAPASVGCVYRRRVS